MSDMNHLQNVGDEEDLSQEETISELATTAVSQLVSDGRSNHVNQITNEAINALIIHIPHPFRMLIITIPIGEVRPWIADSLLAEFVDVNRPERSNADIAQPSDAFRTSLMNLLTFDLIRLIINRISNYLPFGAEDTQAHTLVLPLINRSDQTADINYENGDTNEDATGYDDDLTNFASNEIIVNQMAVTESIPTETADDVPDTQENDRTDIDNRNEVITEDAEPEDQTVNFNINDGQTSPRPQLAIQHPSHDNVQTNTPTTSTPTTSLGSSEQAAEVVPSLAGPTDNSSSTAENPTGLLATGLAASQLIAPDQKQSSPLDVHEEAGESNTVL